MGPTGCPEMSANNQQSTPSNIPEERKSQYKYTIYLHY